MGSWTKGALQGLDQGLVEMPLSGYQQAQEGKERMLPGVVTVFPCLPASCPGSPLTGAPLRRFAETPVRSGRTKTFWSRYHLGENSAACQLLVCRLSVTFYLGLQVPGKWKQMFSEDVYETSVIKVHNNGTQTLLHSVRFLKPCSLEFAWANLYPWAFGPRVFCIETVPVLSVRYLRTNLF